MSDFKIKKLIEKTTSFKHVFQQLENEKDIYIKGLAGSLKALFLSILAEKKHCPVIYVTGDDEQEEIIKQDLETLLGSRRVVYFPKIRQLAEKKLLIDSLKKSQLVLGLEKIIESPDVVVILSAKNLTHKYPSPQALKKQRLLCEVHSTHHFDVFKERLFELGFERERVVESWGEMSVRGGIIDIFPYSSDYPYRIEFFGDQIESIRIFDPLTQRSVKHVSRLMVYPQYPEEQTNSPQMSFGSLFDYFDKSAVVFLDEVKMIEKEVDEFFHNIKHLNETQTEATFSFFQAENFFNWEHIRSHIDEFPKIVHDSFLVSSQKSYYDFASRGQESLQGNLDILKKKIDHFQKENTKEGQPYKIYFLCDRSEQIERMEELFEDAGIDLGRVEFANLGLNQGFVFPDAGLVVFTDNQFYGRQLRWRKRKRIPKGLTLQQLNSLSINDFVVHVDKGIGKYQGLKKITVNGHERECLKIAYRDGDLLYVPLERMDRIQKYSAKEGVVPVLSKLGGKEWERLKKKTKKHIKELARELSQLYAKRKIQQGHAFSKDSLWQKELEASFEYEDTPDQVKATEEIKADMESEYPMDRLVCGDVGYGKTEVAVRAAFKAVNDSKQVAILVPTTILALQHYNLFRERLRNYPIKIEMLTRFRTSAEQKRIVEKLKSGDIDIVIGTHRLLSKDVDFKNIGLLIIDEEHRFGVRKKEALKSRYVNVDVLSMSATPIPRTLNMALLGIRDMSLITTPPRERQPIYTEITPFDIDLIRMAILKEVERGGQVFFVHNRVQTIESVANLIRRNVPGVSVAVAHGQMDERELEKVMWDFATKKYQCLVSTMIIESGLDIPNVNTLIINRADRFGISQLYQLRGRVGRSNTRAYAYLLVPPMNTLKYTSLKRLKIIEEFTELGSGFNIAMRDLEIRGAGNILGAEQSGHIVALGYELYSKIIEEAAQELKLEQEGKPLPKTEQQEEVKIDINRDAYLPDDYIEYPELKVDIYRRLANETDLKVIQQIKEEVEDRFGAIPSPVNNLFHLVELKIMGKALEMRQIKIQDHKLISCFSKKLLSSENRELMENKISWIMDRAQGSFHFFHEGNEGLGIKVDIPETEKDPVEFSIKFLKKLL